MNASHRKNWKFGAFASSVIIASTAVAYSGVIAHTGDSPEKASIATATVTPTATATPTATPRFLQPDCPVGKHSDLAGTETTPAPSAEATQSSESTVGSPYYDGQYSGDAVNAHGWGTMQVVAVIEGGKLVDILVDQYPHATSQSNMITRHALPTLICEALEAQDADIDFVSRATDSSRAFVKSLDSALLDAEIGLDL